MPTRPTLASLLAAGSRGDAAAFVAALYDARGATTRIDAADVLVDGERYRVVESGFRARIRDRFGLTSSSAPSPDAVVAVDPARADVLAERYGVAVVTPTDLDRLARYGLDRSTADAVFRASFDRTVGDVASPATDTRADRTDAVGDAPPTSDAPLSEPTPQLSQSAVIAVLLVAAVIAFGAAASPAVGPDIASLTGISGAGGDGSGAAEPGAGADEAGVANEPRPTTTPTSISDARRLAPGLSIDGVVDAETLADAHVRALSNRSYTWELTYIEFAGDTESGRATEVVTVEGPTTYASRVQTEGFLSGRGPVAYRPSYADGDRRYRPTTDGVDSTPIERRGTTGLQEARASQYYSVLLDGEETSVIRTILGDPRLYVVDINGTSATSVRNYTATVHVAPNGLLTYYSGSYCFASFRDDGTRDTCLRLTMQYRNVDLTSVEPPAWYTNATKPVSPTTTATTTATTATTSADSETQTNGTTTGTTTAAAAETETASERHAAPV